MKDLDDIAKSINDLLYDIKAEVILADLVENGINISDIISSPAGSFKRSYTHDILHAEARKLNNFQQVLQITTSRDGLYDSLPEGLFHEISKTQSVSGKEMATESKKLKLEEKETRNFFLPFENEIFSQLVNLELEERNLLSQYSEDLFNEIFPEFWKIDRSLPRKWVSRMVLFLHYTHQIVSSTEMMAKCLEVVIEENVKVSHRSNSLIKSRESHAPEENCFLLGSVNLGNDTICGYYDENLDTSLEFTIGPLQSTPVEAFFEKGIMTRFLNCFYGFFTPVEADIITTIDVRQDEEGLVLTESGENTFLGYNTLI